MTDFEYRTLQAYANSDLGELFNLTMGKPARTINPKAAQFGTTFHQLILEPGKPVDWNLHHVTERVLLQDMAESFRQNIGPNSLHRLFEFSSFEVVRQWTDQTTGLPCKAKIDILAEATANDRFIVDLKTTSCKNPQEFYDCFIEYGYDRQAAYYLDSVGLDYNFIFIGVQKKKPFNVYEVRMNQSPERRALVDLGRKKNARLLRHVYNEAQIPNGWRPSSWSRKEVLGV